MSVKPRVVWNSEKNELDVVYRNERLISEDPHAYFSMYHDGTSNESGVVVTDETAMRFATLATCVRIRADTIAGLTFRVMRKGLGKDAGKVVEALGHPLNDLLQFQPNIEQDPNTFKKGLQQAQDVRGNGMAYVRRDGGGTPLELIPLASEHSLPFRENGRIYYSLTVNDKLFKAVPQDILHFMPFPDITGVYGRVPFRDMNATIGAGIAARDYSTRMVVKGGSLGSIVELPTDFGQKNSQALETLRAQWQQHYAGVTNAGKTGFLPAGAKFTPLSMMSSTDAQHLENRKYTRDELLGFYNIPPHMAGVLDKVNYNNITALDIQFVKTCVNPMVRVWVEQMNRKLLTVEERKRGVFIDIDTSPLLEASIETRTDLAVKQIAGGIATPNEGRERIGMQPSDDPEMDKIRFPVNTQTIDQINDAAKPEPAPEPEPDDDDPEDDDDEAERTHVFAPIVSNLIDHAKRRMANDVKRTLAQCDKHNDSDEERAEALAGLREESVDKFDRTAESVREALSRSGDGELIADAGNEVFDHMAYELIHAIDQRSTNELLEQWLSMATDNEEITQSVLRAT